MTARANSIAEYGCEYINGKPVRITAATSAANLADLTAAAKRVGANKYGNIKTTVDGIEFDSKREADRYTTLKMRQMVGAISGLEWDKKALHYDLTVNGCLIGVYTPDFRYWCNGAVVCEDVKSNITKTQAYGLRKKLMKAIHGIEVIEI